MTRVGIYLAPINDVTGPKFSGRYYDIAYKDLFAKIIALGATPILVHSAEKTYASKGVFSEYWTVSLVSGAPVFEKHTDSIQLGFLYDKARFPYDDMRVLNPPMVRDICANKYLSYLFAPEYHEETYIAYNDQELEVLRLGWAGRSDQRVAIKELDSNGGNKVYVGAFKEYDNTLSFPVIVQGFIDTSGGCPELADGMHDVRVAAYNGEIIHGLVRRPGGDSLKSNMQYGGESTALYIQQIPPELKRIIKELDRKLEQYGDRYFSADFGYNGDSWKLFELNAYPGLATVETDGEATEEYMQLLAEHLIRSAKEE